MLRNSRSWRIFPFATFALSALVVTVFGLASAELHAAAPSFGPENILAPTTENLIPASPFQYWKADTMVTPGTPVTTAVESHSYNYFYSDIIPVADGEKFLLGSIWAKRPTDAVGTEGKLYYGIEQYDANMKPISSGKGTVYFVAAQEVVPADGMWHKYEKSIILPQSHTPFQGSDGGAVRFIRARVLVNYNAGTLATQWGGVELRYSQPDDVVKPLDVLADTDENLLTDSFLRYQLDDRATIDGSSPISTGARSNGYNYVYSDIIAVETGDTLAGSIWAKRASDATGTEGKLYYGIERYDSNMKPISSGKGIENFVAKKVSVPTNGTWRHYTGATTLPVTHIPFEGSDGGAVRFVRARVLVNHAAGTIPTEWGGVELRRVQPEQLAALFIQQMNTGFTDTTVANKKNVTLLRYEARAEGADVLLTKTAFTKAQGDLRNGENYAWWVDTNADGIVDTILEDGVASDGNTSVTFLNPFGGGFVIPEDSSVIFEVHADIASSLQSNQSLQLAFGTTTDAGYITAEKLDDGVRLIGIETNGSCPHVIGCSVHVFTGQSIHLDIRQHGDLYITNSTTPTRARQLLGGVLGEVVLRVALHAEIEPTEVTFLSLSVIGNKSSVERFELFVPGATTPFAVASASACGGAPADFCAVMQNQELTVPRGNNINVLVRPRIESDSNGGVSGHTFAVRLSTVEARGIESSNTITPDVLAPIVGEQNTVVMSKVVSITNANPDPNGTAIPVGQGYIGAFQFSDAPNGNTQNGLNKTVIKDLLFTVDARNIEMNEANFTVFNPSNGSVSSSCSVVGSAAPLLFVACTDIDAAGVDTEISSGSDETLVLRGEVQNPKVNPAQTSFLQVRLQNFSNASLSSFGQNDSHIRILDTDFGGSIEFFWVEYPETTINSTSYSS